MTLLRGDGARGCPEIGSNQHNRPRVDDPAIPAWRHVRAGAPKTHVPRPTQRLHGPFSLPQNLNEAQYAENQSKVHRQKS